MYKNPNVPFFFLKREKSLIFHIWSLCIVKEAMFINVIGLWPIRLFISDLYISGTHNFFNIYFLFSFSFPLFLNGRFYAWLGPERDSSAIDWLLYFGEKQRRKKVLDYYDSSVFIITAIMTYDDENKINDIYFTCFGISCSLYFGLRFFFLVVREFDLQI